MQKNFARLAQLFRQTSPSLVENVEELVGVYELELMQPGGIVDEVLKQIKMLVDGRLLISCCVRCKSSGHLLGASTEMFFQIVVYYRRNKLRNIAAQTGDFLNGGGTDKRILGFCHEKNSF